MLLAMALAPLLVTLDSWDGWKTIAASQGWQWAVVDKGPCTDAGVKELEALVSSRQDIDPDRVYLAGRGEEAPCVFYAVSRVPHLWGAAVAVEGNPRRAIETNRLFSANLQMTQVLWMVSPDPERRKIPGVTETADISAENLVRFLSKARRAPFPLKVDYETGSLNFLRCFWVEIAKPDPLRRNDALPVTRVAPGSGAYLSFGGFGYDPKKEGPGAEVVWLPPNYSGPLKLGDRIVAIAGRPIDSGRDYARYMEEAREERAVVVTVQRGKERLRLDARILLPKREENLTVRVQAEFLPDSKEILLVSRGIAAVKLTVPKDWVPVSINWNGNLGPKLEAPGCHLITDSGNNITAAGCDASPDQKR